jgi:hypothetical protein
MHRSQRSLQETKDELEGAAIEAKDYRKQSYKKIIEVVEEKMVKLAGELSIAKANFDDATLDNLDE